MAERLTLTVPEAAAQLGCRKETLYAAIRDGKCDLPTIRVGRKILIPRQRLEQLLAGELGAEPRENGGGNPP
jgi:excisionase family DNA binding protein